MFVHRVWCISTVISIVNPAIFLFLFKKSIVITLYIVLHYLCIKLKKKKNKLALLWGCFYHRVTNLTSFSPLISVTLFLKVMMKTLFWSFSYAVWANGNAKIYLLKSPVHHYTFTQLIPKYLAKMLVAWGLMGFSEWLWWHG